MTISIVLADDEELIRGALATLLELEDDITVVGQAGDGEHALRLIDQNQPDVAVLDLEMPLLDGIQAAERIQDTPVVIVTRHARPGVLRRALAVGVRGFVPKSTPAARLASILRDVHQGKRYVDPEIAASALTAGECPLSERELELLRHTRAGLSASEIATTAHLAPGTVRNYLSSAIAKLTARDRHHAARIAWEEGWI